MSMETDSLETKAEHHRARVDSTLDEIRDRLSVGQLFDEAWSQLRQGEGADVVKNIGRQARDNPLALGLIGAGLVWLLAGEGVRAESRELKRRFDDWNDWDDRREGWTSDRDNVGWPYRYRNTPPESGDYVTGLRPRGGLTTGSGETSESSLFDKAKGQAPSFAGKASDATSRAGDAISGAAGSAADAAGRAGQSVSDTASAAGQSIYDTASAAGQSIADAAGSAAETARRYGAEASDAARFAAEEAGRYGRYARREVYARGQRLRRTVLDSLYEEPLIFGGIALAVGTAIGVALPPTKREDKLLGSTRDDLRDEAYAYGEDIAKRARRVAEKAYETASEKADEKGLKPEGGETLADKASDVVKAAAEEARTEAKKQGLT